MKKGISFSKEECDGNIIRCYQKDGRICMDGNGLRKRPRMEIRYSKDTTMYSHRFLSWENLTYAYVEPGEDELDDYLLNHALQDDKKTSVAVYTRRIDEIHNTFSDEYNIEYVEEEDGFYQVFVARKGALKDYFNIEELEEYYESADVPYNEGIVDVLAGAEMIDIFLRKLDFYGTVPYYPIMDMEGGDGIGRSYGAAGGLIAGLLFGYPVESSISMVEQNGIFSPF